MTPAEAEKVINQYGAAIASIEENAIVQDVFSLPYSPAKIRYAYFVYVEALIQQGILTDKIAGDLSQTYAMIDSRFVEEAAEINKAWPQYASSEAAREIINKHGGLTALMPSTKKMIEFHNYIADCQGNWRKPPASNTVNSA